MDNVRNHSFSGFSLKYRTKSMNRYTGIFEVNIGIGIGFDDRYPTLPN